MKKRLLIFILMFAICTPIITYALGLQNSASEQTQEFFYTSNTQASPGDVITMSIDLSKINYQNFEFSLSSNTNINDISTADENVNSTTENNKFKIISNKTDVNMDKIDLYYKIPENAEIGSKISFEGTIKECLNSEETESEESLAEGSESYEITDSTETSESSTSKTVTITIEIVEKTSDTENSSDNKSENEQDNDSAGIQSNGQNTKNAASSQMSSSKTSGSGSLNQETVTYEGDCNNYLESLSIEGYDLTPVFLKTNNTYFINVDSAVSSLNITAKPESDDAKINIYGSSGLTDGENKILIFVTAENGDVRTYRIYVTK